MLIKSNCRYFDFIAHCIIIRMEVELKKGSRAHLRAGLLHLGDADANSPLVCFQTFDCGEGLNGLRETQ